VIDEHAPHRPAGPLRPLVAWCTGYRQAGMAPRQHRGLPSPSLTLVITLDDPLEIAGHPDPSQPPSQHEVLLGGLHTSPALVSHPGRWSGIQLALTPRGARALLGMPAATLANIDVEAADVLGGLASEVRERVLDSQDWPGRFAAIEAFIARRAAQAPEQRARPEVGYAWRRLRETHGALPVAALASETGWSARHLAAQFRAETGLSPKEAARVIRFDRARKALAARYASGQPSQLASLAADCGYYDQAHLAREFRELAGCPPSQWLAEEFRNVQAARLTSGNDGGHERRDQQPASP
jgi:AraC-like DNA-binding protein